MNTKLHLFICALVLAAENLPAIEFSNSVPVTTNMFFFLNSRADFHPQVKFKSDEIISFTRATAGTNYIFYKALPFQQTFDFHLFDQKGREIQKTERGLAYSQEAVPPKSKSEAVNCKIQAIEYEPYALFVPEEMFAITNKGTYDFEIRIRILVPASNGVLNVGSMLNGTNVAFAKELGMVVSEPLRVKVIKE